MKKFIPAVREFFAEKPKVAWGVTILIILIFLAALGAPQQANSADKPAWLIEIVDAEKPDRPKLSDNLEPRFTQTQPNGSSMLEVWFFDPKDYCVAATSLVDYMASRDFMLVRSNFVTFNDVDKFPHKPVMAHGFLHINEVVMEAWVLGETESTFCIRSQVIRWDPVPSPDA